MAGTEFGFLNPEELPEDEPGLGSTEESSNENSGLEGLAPDRGFWVFVGTPGADEESIGGLADHLEASKNSPVYEALEPPDELELDGLRAKFDELFHDYLRNIPAKVDDCGEEEVNRWAGEAVLETMGGKTSQTGISSGFVAQAKRRDPEIRDLEGETDGDRLARFFGEN